MVCINPAVCLKLCFCQHRVPLFVLPRVHIPVLNDTQWRTFLCIASQQAAVDRRSRRMGDVSSGDLESLLAKLQSKIMCEIDKSLLEKRQVWKTSHRFFGWLFSRYFVCSSMSSAQHVVGGRYLRYRVGISCSLLYSHIAIELLHRNSDDCFIGVSNN